MFGLVDVIGWVGREGKGREGSGSGKWGTYN